MEFELTPGELNARSSGGKGTSSRINMHSQHADCGSELDRPVQVKNSLSADLNPLPDQLAGQLAAAGGDLAGLQPVLPQPLRPVGDQGAVRRTGHRVFRDADPRREEARDEIGTISRRGRDHTQGVQLRKALEIGL